MENIEYNNIYRNEGGHYYYQTNHNIFLTLLNKYLLLYTTKKKLRILDAGCGTGLLSKKISQFANVWGIDISETALTFSRKRGVKVKKASVEKIPFRNNVFDAVISLDVIYHKQVKSDKLAISEMCRVLKPRGILIIRVPAIKWLRSKHDKFVHTKQRYYPMELRNKLSQAGFKTLKLSYVNLLLYFPATIRFCYEKLNPNRPAKSAITKVPTFINRLIIFVLSIENLLLDKIDLPFGLGLVAVGIKQKKLA